jgi:hypothetical protein
MFAKFQKRDGWRILCLPPSANLTAPAAMNLEIYSVKQQIFEHKFGDQAQIIQHISSTIRP